MTKIKNQYFQMTLFFKRKNVQGCERIFLQTSVHGPELDVTAPVVAAAVDPPAVDRPGVDITQEGSRRRRDWDSNSVQMTSHGFTVRDYEVRLSDIRQLKIEMIEID
jgi:hypothetical protein